MSIPVINGDEHDRRFEDNAGSIVALKLKGINTAARECNFAI